MCRNAVFAIFLWLALPSAVNAQQAELEVLSPREDRPTTAREFVNVLGRTRPGRSVRVAGEAVVVFGTGVFARDRVPLEPGLNRIPIEAVAADGSITSRVLEVERTVARVMPPQPLLEVPPVWPLDPPEAMEVIGPDVAELLHGVHDVRLGGPFIAEAAAGTRLLATARRGDLLRVQLAPGFSAWLPRSAVQRRAEAGVGVGVGVGVGATPAPIITTLSVSGHSEGDVVQVPMSSPLPYSVRAVPGGLEIDLFGTHLAATWISHRASAKQVREVTAEALGDERIRLRVALQGARAAVWGWRVEQLPGALRVIVRAPPAVAASGSPLRGLHVALEAGHGSTENSGAIGATGTPEKDINRWTTDALAAELRGAGASVTMVREGDENPPLRERARRVLASQAQLFVSVHANSADTGNGFLRVSGTSHYYKSSHSRDLAAAVHRQMLAVTGLEDFGLVGNFNYAPLRLVTSMPAILVEQAFVSHPGDEARLLDPAFRALMARAVRQGIEDFLRPSK